MFRKMAFLVLIGMVSASCATALNPVKTADSNVYEMISVSNLQKLVEAEDFTFINVHIPLEGSIPGTDAEIPFDKIQNYLDQLPEDKDAEIVVYCLSGPMGDVASQTLVDLGYTNVSNLEGGYIAWQAAGLPFME